MITRYEPDDEIVAPDLHIERLSDRSISLNVYGHLFTFFAMGDGEIKMMEQHTGEVQREIDARKAVEGEG